MSRLSLAVTLVALLAGAAARAQGVVFADDFETGTLLTSEVPAGRWASLDDATPQEQLRSSAAAAHRGAFGARVTDAITGADNLSVHLYHPEPARTGPYYVRMWVRMVSTNNFNVYLATTHSPASNNCSHELEFSAVQGRLNSAGWALGVYSSDATTTALGTAWHLIEWGMTGIGTATTRRRAWVDGALQADSTVNTTGASIGELMLGEYWGDTAWQGTIDYDDFRASTVPPASHFSLTTAASVEAEACVTVTLSLRDSVSNALSPAPYAVVASADVTGAVDTFLDGACLTQGATWSLPAGQSTGTFSYRPRAPGSITAGAAHADFLPLTPLAVTVTAKPNGAVCSAGPACASGACIGGICAPPDAGAPADAGLDDAGSADAGPDDAGAPDASAGDAGAALAPLVLPVGCSCGTAPTPLLLALGLLLLVRLASRTRAEPRGGSSRRS